jgi:hypothetical protein
VLGAGRVGLLGEKYTGVVYRARRAGLMGYKCTAVVYTAGKVIIESKI